VKSKNFKIFYLIVFLSVITDQLSKLLVLNLLENRISYDIFRYFSITLVKNTGLCFGLFNNAGLNPLVIAGAFIVGIIILLYIHKAPEVNSRFLVSLGLIEGGIIGNVIDRIKMGAVIDFINLHFWPVFNFADVFIVSGIILSFFVNLKKKRELI
jgi:signal peptidase II